jgi:lactate 2-monooxygenase
LVGQLPNYPIDDAARERKAAEALPSSIYSYVAGGCGDEGTQRANAEAIQRYAITPRMLVGVRRPRQPHLRADRRDLSVTMLGMTLPTPLCLSPIGVVGLCAQDHHRGGPTRQRCRLG